MIRHLYPHQKEAFKYTLEEKNPALFMDMRLGKTLVVIRRTKLYDYPDKKILVVGPGSVIDGWIKELNLENETSIILYASTKQKRLNILKENTDINWFIINKEGVLSIPEIAVLPWDVVVFDESHWIRNPKAQLTRFMIQQFTHVKHKWILTGTPNPEDDLEFFTQMQFLHNEFCGCKNYWKYRTEFFEHADYLGWTWKYRKEKREEAESELADKVFIMSRKDAKMEKEKVHETRYIEFPDHIRKLYDKIENDFALETLDGKINLSTIWATEKYLWLRRLCGGWLSTDQFIWGDKVLELKSLLTNELRKEKVIVWFSFNLEIDHTYEYFSSIKRFERKFARLDASVKLNQRGKIINEFNDSDLDVLFIQQAIAQSGVDLSGADTAIYYSENPSRLMREQTEDRILDMKKFNPLLYINLVAKDSVDEDIRFINRIKGMKSKLSLGRILKRKLLERNSK